MPADVRFEDGPDGTRPDAVIDGDVVSTGRPPPAWLVRLEAARGRHRTSLRRLGAGVAAVTAVAVATALAAVTVPQDTVVAGQGRAGRSAVVDAAAPGALVRATAAGPLTDYVRPTSAAGACPAVAVGTSPAAAIGRAVATTLPGFTVTGTARVLDEFTGLCSIRLRARGPGGVVLAVQVSSPDGAPTALPYDPLVVGNETAADGTATEWVSLDSARRWLVVVGAVGPTASLPSSADLQQLAQDDSLTW